LELESHVKDQLIDRLVDGDKELLTLYRLFKHSREQFERHVGLYLQEQQESSSKFP
jgi:hypothetical protein